MSSGDTNLTLSMQNIVRMDFSLLIEWDQFLILSAICGLLFLISLFLYRKGFLARGLCACAFLFMLANPSIIEQESTPAHDVALIIVDRSESQNIQDRNEQTEAALSSIQNQLQSIDNLKFRVVYSDQDSGLSDQKTELFHLIEHEYRDVPATQRAGVILITDGQVHDIPEINANLDSFGPIHSLITGERDEQDRRIELIEAPAYGIVDQDVTIRFAVRDTDNINEEFAVVTITENDNLPRNMLVRVNEQQSMTFPLQHRGENIIHLQVEVLQDEVTGLNNDIPVVINGIRDRLKVLLVSGQPHIGGRTWRNLLTSDPGVDLVHFTILRDPTKQDRTPQHELSLIAFPFRELFEVKLYDFDLIIFDRYTLKRILPKFYFSNIARFVEQGGAFLEVSGPEFASENSIYTTALQDILPASPTGTVIEEQYTPQITDIGARHPVTQGLGKAPLSGGANTDTAQWGQWFRQISTNTRTGNVVMSGARDLPLLVLDRVGEGRVAQLTSDQIWLWSRGFENGGPHLNLMRRLAHWLMKEPELEENALFASIQDDSLFIERRSLSQESITATIKTPDGSSSEVLLTYDDRTNSLVHRKFLEQSGVYEVSDSENTTFAVAGEVNPLEFQDVLSTEKALQPIAKATEGGVLRLSDLKNQVSIRHLENRRQYTGRNWIGLKKNNAFLVSGTKEIPLFPNWLYAALLLIILTSGWWFEGRSSK